MGIYSERRKKRKSLDIQCFMQLAQKYRTKIRRKSERRKIIHIREAKLSTLQLLINDIFWVIHKVIHIIHIFWKEENLVKHESLFWDYCEIAKKGLKKQIQT